MQMWLTLILAVQLLSALTMILLVLLQHGKGADMGASFGGGSSGSLFGASGSANFLSRSTAATATVFFLCTLALAYLGSSHTRPVEAGSVLDRPAGAASAPADAIPGAAPGAIPGGAAPAAAPGAIPGTAPAASAAIPAPMGAPK